MEERKQAGSAEEGSREENFEETEEVQMQPQPSPERLLLGLQSFRKPLFACPLQKERNFLSSIIVAPDLELHGATTSCSSCHLDRSHVFKKLWNCCPHEAVAFLGAHERGNHCQSLAGMSCLYTFSLRFWGVTNCTVMA